MSTFAVDSATQPLKTLFEGLSAEEKQRRPQSQSEDPSGPVPQPVLKPS